MADPFTPTTKQIMTLAILVYLGFALIVAALAPVARAIIA